MMNYIWVGLVVIAVIAGGVTGTMEDVLNNVFNFANEAVNICLGLIGIMAFFCGLMKVMEKAGICDLIAKALAPIMTRLFYSNNDKSHLCAYAQTFPNLILLQQQMPL